MQTSPVALYIVVADDDLEDHQLIKEAVKECNTNHVVTSVYNGSQLMDLLLQRGYYKHDFESMPDLIILDIRMPIMNGFDALKEIKQNEKLRDIPVYVLTEIRSQKDADIALSMGAIDYSSKPLNYGEMKSLMLSICVRTKKRV
jgi:CheY-like chemotaxis protein